MKVIRKIKELRTEIAKIKAKGKTIALVPTMGALHEGHMSLVEVARKKADFTVASIFVNPKQFGPNEDFAQYPRTEKEDLQKLRNKADLVFIPSAAEIYPEGFSSIIAVGKIGQVLEGKFRPGFFNGVATVVAKFFSIVQPDVAIFGEKDYQQLQVIKTLVRDLDIPVKIIPGKTIREKDGLAMSSRNRYLSAGARKIAPLLYKVLREAAVQIKARKSLEKTLDEAKKVLRRGGVSEIDYIELVDDEKNGRLLAAVWLGKTRLIDNVGI